MTVILGLIVTFLAYDLSATKKEVEKFKNQLEDAKKQIAFLYQVRANDEP